MTATELASIGVVTLDDLEQLGPEETLRRWIERFPDRLNVNAALGLVVTIEGGVWTDATAGQRASARRLVGLLRAEQGTPLPRPSARRRRSPVRAPR